MKRLHLLLALVCCSPLVLLPAETLAPAQSTVQLKSNSEVIAEVEASSPGSSWDQDGAEAALLDVIVDGVVQQQVILTGGAQRTLYRVSLGELSAGRHVIAVRRNDQWSAPGSKVEVSAVRALDARQALSASNYLALKHAPILFARADTLGHFTDAPLLMYFTSRKRDKGGIILEYTVVFSNEDGGTPSKALMARWGRTTDIEYVYRVELGADESIVSAHYQSNDHKDAAFTGRKMGTHPVLLVCTLNNVFCDRGYSPVQYRFVPSAIDLESTSREAVMDRFPWTYMISGQELQREHKIRELGSSASPNLISDPRNYLYVELTSQTQGCGLAVRVKRKNDLRWYSSNSGQADLTVWRSGFARTTVELPPDTQTTDVEQITVECVDLRNVLVQSYLPQPAPKADNVRVTKVFLLDGQYRPQLVDSSTAEFNLISGESRSTPVSERGK